MFSESYTGSWAVLQLPCCPSKQGGLLENILQNLRNKWPPHLVQILHCEDHKTNLYVSPVKKSSCATKREQAKASRSCAGGVRSFLRAVCTATWKAIAISDRDVVALDSRSWWGIIPGGIQVGLVRGLPYMTSELEGCPPKADEKNKISWFLTVGEGVKNLKFLRTSYMEAPNLSGDFVRMISSGF